MKTRRLSLPLFAVVVLIYLAIIQIGGLLVTAFTGVNDVFTNYGVFVSMIIPLGVALIFTYGVIAYLGWWPRVLRDDRPVRRWVSVVPIVFLVAIALGLNYVVLAEKGFVYVILLLIATQFVGWGEEGMFRGIGVLVLRDHGLSEGRVALWSSVVFGAVHLVNGLTHGVSAIPQAIMVSLAGYFFYLIRRVSGGNVLNSVVHGLFDFTLLSGTAIMAGQVGYLGIIPCILVYPILAIILVIKRRTIEPAQVPPAGFEPATS